MGNSKYEYHVQQKLDFWIRLGIRKRYQPDTNPAFVSHRGEKLQFPDQITETMATVV